MIPTDFRIITVKVSITGTCVDKYNYSCSFSLLCYNLKWLAVVTWGNDG